MPGGARTSIERAWERQDVGARAEDLMLFGVVTICDHLREGKMILVLALGLKLS